jgi:predicted GIY-YIG superfamily endonuclease
VFQAYVVRSSATPKVYIGITGGSLARRWSQHVSNAINRPVKTALYKAILKYGMAMIIN